MIQICLLSVFNMVVIARDTLDVQLRKLERNLRHLALGFRARIAAFRNNISC